MVNDAESHADEDKKRKEVVEARNQADSLVHSTENNLKEHGDKISEEDKTVIEDLVVAAHNNAKNNLKTKTSEEISKATGGFDISKFKLPF